MIRPFTSSNNKRKMKNKVVYIYANGNRILSVVYLHFGCFGFNLSRCSVGGRRQISQFTTLQSPLDGAFIDAEFAFGSKKSEFLKTLLLLCGAVFLTANNPSPLVEKEVALLQTTGGMISGFVINLNARSIEVFVCFSGNVI